MQKQDEIFEMLGVAPSTLNINAVQITEWGTTLQLDCLYEDKPFQVVFEDCKSIQWDVRGHPDERDTSAEVAGLFLGQSEHRESAIIVTDVCEIAVQYGELMLLKTW
ncbi:MAG: hypothetical protein OHK0023_03030 [Anaerolineae bacterium]